MAESTSQRSTAYNNYSSIRAPWLTEAATLRKQKKLTQQVLTDLVGIHVVQIHGYEGGDAQPTLEVIRKLAIALSTSADEPVFDHNEREPDHDVQMQFESLAPFTRKRSKWPSRF
jgi:transcriptional regulator with XRE-family HTH domain